MSPPSQVKASVKTSKFQNAKPPSSLKSFIAKAFERELFCLLFPPPPPPPPRPPMANHPQNGLWSLASASMIHPSVHPSVHPSMQAPENVEHAMMSRMVAARQHPDPSSLPQHYMAPPPHHYPPMQREPEPAALSNDSAGKEDGQNKKRKHRK
mmetsp:Transcript_30563/g.52180  ORF Transcript_30563/g.52180 Transcript_30563/m.52180 type:complete len:153 (-) Transcript_30563:251-709(-)